MTNNENSDSSRLDQVEAILLRLAQQQEADRAQVSDLWRMVASNNKYLEAFSADVAGLKESIVNLKDSVASLANNVNELTDDVKVTQRQLREVLRRVDTMSSDMRDIQMSVRDLVADTREVQIENSRILRYLESRSG